MSKVCRQCHWYLMSCGCLKRHDMTLGLIGKCEHFMPYCKTKEEFELALQMEGESQRAMNNTCPTCLMSDCCGGAIADTMQDRITELEKQVNEVADCYDLEHERAEKAEAENKRLMVVVEAANRVAKQWKGHFVQGPLYDLCEAIKVYKQALQGEES